MHHREPADKPRTLFGPTEVVPEWSFEVIFEFAAKHGSCLYGTF